MSPATSYSATTSANTLPPIRSLGLFDIRQCTKRDGPCIHRLNDLNDPSVATDMPRTRKFNDRNGFLTSKPTATPVIARPIVASGHYVRPRRSSVSFTLSSSSVSSREPSPTTTATSSTLSTSGPRAPNVDLVLSTWEKADAILVVPPLAAPPALPPHSRNGAFDHPLLFVGAAGLQQLRRSMHRFGGARFHPYRLVGRADRRSSTASSAGSSDA